MIIVAILTVLALIFVWSLAKSTAKRDAVERESFERDLHPFRK